MELGWIAWLECARRQASDNPYDKPKKRHGWAECLSFRNGEIAVASLLVRRAVEEATRLKIPSLFLWTSTAEALYLKLGWRAIERTDYCGQRIVIMEYASVKPSNN